MSDQPQPLASFDFSLLEDDPALQASMENFLRYSSYRIQEQALPTFFDGLVPSQRKLLLSMSDMKAWSGSKLQKSSRITAQSAAAYHPVGNTYQVLVNVSQDWRVQSLLTAPEGNWGEIENGAAAAERYTEIRFSEFGEKVLFEDMPAERHTTERDPHSIVPCSITYTGMHWEEDYLPARLPMLLINGSNGIAVGIAQTFQPLSIRPLLAEVLRYIKTGEVVYENLRLGFPTNPRITSSQEDFIAALKNGRGSVRSTATLTYEYNRQKLVSAIVATSTPHGQTLNEIGDKLNEWRAAGSAAGVVACPFKSFRNETEKKDIRLVFALDKPTNNEIELNNAKQLLLKNTLLTSSHTINMTALKGSFPVSFTFDSFLHDWVEERGNIIQRGALKRAVELERQHRRQKILFWVKSHLDATTTFVKTAETREILYGQMAALPGLEPALEPDEITIVEDLNLGQLSRFSEQDALKRMDRLVADIAAERYLVDNESARREVIVKDIQWFSDNLDKLGLPNHCCEFDPELGELLDRKTSKLRLIAGTQVAPQADSTPWWHAVANTSNELDILLHTKKGALLRISNKSVRSTPYTPAIVDAEDYIVSASFIKQDLLLLITDTGRMLTLPRESLPYNQPVYPARVGMLLKLKDAPEYVTPVIALTDKPYDLVVVGDSGVTKRIPLADINSTRQSVIHPTMIRYAALASELYFHLSKSDLENQTSIKTEMLTEGSLKRTGRLGSVPNLGPASRKENGMFIAIGADAKSIYKKTV